MRLRLSTLLLLVTIAALGMALANQQRVPDVVLIDNHEYIWRLGLAQLSSVWEDTSNAPPLSQTQALDTANRIIEHLERSEDQLSFGDLSLKSLSLVRIEPNSPSWGYQIFISARADGKLRSPDLAFLLMFDGTIGFQTLKYGQTLKSVMKKFDPENGIMHVHSTLE